MDLEEQIKQAAQEARDDSEDDGMLDEANDLSNEDTKSYLESLDFDEPKDVTEELDDEKPSSEDKEDSADDDQASSDEQEETAVDDSQEEKSEEVSDDEKPDKEGQQESASEKTEKPVVTEEDLARAIDLGLKPDDVKQYAEIGNLSKTLDSLEARRGSQSSGKQAESKNDSEQQSEEFRIKLDFGENQDEYDPEFISKFEEQVNEQVGGQLKRVNDTVSQLKNSLDYERQLNFEREFDQLVGETIQNEPGYKDILGEGRGRNLEREGEPMKNRMAVLSKMTDLAKNDNQKSNEELFKDALGIVFRDQQQKIATKKVRSD